MEALDLEKTNSLFNLINHESDIDKICLNGRDPYEVKCQFLINKKESAGVKHLNDSEVSLNTQMIWIKFIKTLKNTTEIKNGKHYSLLVIWLLMKVMKKLIQ